MKKVALIVLVLLACSGCSTTKGTWFPTASEQDLVERDHIILYEVKF
jgi:uncharacterized protein YcfL